MLNICALKSMGKQLLIPLGIISIIALFFYMLLSGNKFLQFTFLTFTIVASITLIGILVVDWYNDEVRKCNKLKNKLPIKDDPFFLDMGK